MGKQNYSCKELQGDTMASKPRTYVHIFFSGESIEMACVWLEKNCLTKSFLQHCFFHRRGGREGVMFLLCTLRIVSQSLLSKILLSLSSDESAQPCKTYNEALR